MRANMDERYFLRHCLSIFTHCISAQYMWQKGTPSSRAYNQGHVEHALRHAKWQHASTGVHTYASCTPALRMASVGQGCAVLSSFIQSSSICLFSALHQFVQISCSPAVGFRRIGSFLQNVLLHCPFHSCKHTHAYTHIGHTRSVLTAHDCSHSAYSQRCFVPKLWQHSTSNSRVTQSFKYCSPLLHYTLLCAYINLLYIDMQ